MMLGLGERLAAAEPRRVAPDVRPLVEELAVRLGDRAMESFRPDLRRIETIPPADRLLVDAAEVTRQRGCGSGRGEKAVELRVLPVAARAALQNPLREQRLPPQRDQPARVEMFGMKGPEAHDSGCALIGSCVRLPVGFRQHHHVR